MNITAENIEDRKLILDFSSQAEAINQWTDRHKLSKYLFEEGLIGEVDQVHILAKGLPYLCPFSPYTFLRG